MSDTPSTRANELQQLFRSARTAAVTSEGEAGEMARNRAVNQRVASRGGGGSLQLAHGRPTDPLWYWKQGNLPFNIWEDETGEEMRRVREFCRLLYITHPLLGSAIDIYSKYPLSGMEITCGKDPAIADFYSELFMNDLRYEDFLPDIGREYWLIGEAFPLASFNEITGTFDSDDLMLPEDVNVINSPFSNDPRFEMALPHNIRQILNDRWPLMEYKQLIEAYPEFLALNVSNWTYMSSNRDRYMIPVSDKLMQHVMRRGDSFFERGIPIMMRAFRAVAQEEMLNAAQDSISQRLYTPLILAKIGASATDLGTQTPWIPQQGDLDDFTADVNNALAADFRLITTHFAVSMQNVFGRESMPNLSQDYARLEERMLQAFGISKTMLSGASGGQTYAADALNRDTMTQLLLDYQRKIKRFFRKRAEVVAEAQGHYDFDRKGGRIVPIMEKVLETDEETGDVRVVERPKLLLPELKIKAMDMKSEDQMNDLLEQLRAAGVPISQRTRLVNVPIDLDEEAEAVVEEQVQQAVFAAEVRRKTYMSLKARGLPIPEDLEEDFRPKVLENGQDAPEQADQLALMPGEEPEVDEDGNIIPTLGTDGPDVTALVPPTDETENSEGKESLSPQNRVLHRPPESDEQRKGMPRAAAFRLDADFDSDGWFQQFGSAMEVVEHPLMHNLEHLASASNSEESDGESLSIKTADLTDPANLSNEENQRAATIPVVGSIRLRHLSVERNLAFHYRADQFESDEDES